MTNKIVLAACGLFLGASAASAASVGYTEGFRGLVDDTTQIGFGEANDSDSPFMLTDPALSAGDSVELYGMIRGMLITTASSPARILTFPSFSGATAIHPIFPDRARRIRPACNSGRQTPGI